jgi:tetratricopeptide (TPR) repeat protein
MQRARLRKLTFLIGAGAGVPAGLPTAAELLDTVAHYLITDRGWADELARLSQPAGPLRFELAMEWLAGTTDPKLSVLQLFDVGKPGPLHAALASAAVAGAHLLTVNFDDLLEQALATAGDSPWTIDAHAGGTHAPDGAVEVVKLHGTRKSHRGQDIRPAAQPLHVTIGQIVRSGGGFNLAPAAGSLLRLAVNQRHLVVVGYSGSDDLDVMPALAECNPAQVTWIEHEADTAPASVSLGSASAQVRDLLGSWVESGVDVVLVKGSTARALQDMGLDVPPPLSPSEYSARQKDWHASVKQWAEVVRPQNPNGLGWAALTLGALGYRRRSLDATVASEPSPLPDGVWSVQRRLYEIAQQTYLLADSNMDDVLDRAAEAVTAADKNQDLESVADAEMLAARALMFDGRFEESAAALARAERALRQRKPEPPEDWSRAYLDQIAARLHLRRGESSQAREAALRAAERLGRFGGWSEKSESLQIAAQADWHAEDYESGLGLLTEAVRIARTGPYPDQLESALLRQASIRYAAGDVEGGYQDAKESVSVAELYELTGEIFQQLAVWGTTANELERFEEAGEAFERAIEAGGLQSAWGPDIVLGLADANLHAGLPDQCLRILNKHDDIIQANPWDVAHAQVIRWAAGVVSTQEADDAVAHAQHAAPPPYARPVMCILRLGLVGTANQRLLDDARSELEDAAYARRLRRLQSARERAIAQRSM